MSIYLTSDQHIHHKKCLELTHRPFNTIEDMNKALIDNHNSIVKSDDICIFLGDFIMGRDKFNTFPQIIPKLNGLLVLLKGNHDMAFDDKCEGRVEAADKLYMDNGISKVYTGIVSLSQVLDDCNVSNPTTKDIILCHFPFKGYEDTNHDNQYEHLLPIDTGQILFSGHTHQRQPMLTHPRNINVGVDAHGYKPVSLIDLLAQLEAFDRYPVKEVIL